MIKRFVESVSNFFAGKPRLRKTPKRIELPPMPKRVKEASGQMQLKWHNVHMMRAHGLATDDDVAAVMALVGE